MSKCKSCGEFTLAQYCKQCSLTVKDKKEAVLASEKEIIALLEEEYEALSEVRESKEYLLGFEHALLLLKLRYQPETFNDIPSSQVEQEGEVNDNGK